MKKGKVILSVVALAVAMSASFAFTAHKNDTTVYGKDASGNPHAVLLSEKDITWECIDGVQVCYYADPALTQPLTSANFQFEFIAK